MGCQLFCNPELVQWPRPVSHPICQVAYIEGGMRNLQPPGQARFLVNNGWWSEERE